MTDYPTEHAWLFDKYPYAFGWACTYTTDTAGRPILLTTRDERIQLLAGGMIDPGELPHQAAIRETREETGRVLTGELTLLASVFRPADERFPVRFGYIFDGGMMTDAEIEAIVLSEEHTDYGVRSLAEWQPLVPPEQFTLISQLDAARRTGVPAYIARPGL